MGDSVPFESRSSSPCIKDASSLMLSAPSLSSLRPFDWSAAGRGLTLRRRCSSRSSASVGSSSRGGAAGRWKSVSVTDVINLEGDGVSDTARSSGLTAASSATAGSCSRNWTSESPRRWLRAPRVSIASAIAGVDGTCRSVSVSDMVSAGRAGRGGVVWTGADRSPKAGAAGGMCSSVAVSDEERTGARPRSEKLFGDSALADGRGGGGGGDPSVTSGASTRNDAKARRLGRLPGLRPVRPLRSARSFAATLSRRRSTLASRAFSESFVAGRRGVFVWSWGFSRTAPAASMFGFASSRRRMSERASRASARSVVGGSKAAARIFCDRMSHHASSAVSAGGARRNRVRRGKASDGRSGGCFIAPSSASKRAKGSFGIVQRKVPHRQLSA
mmetsp:Transcript_13158/g.38945  ORF Transcript_13158/g.38945 Transcript_13158/m.38945 type:complete len:388 (+) Transcript_13158:197-1360(+)